MGKATKWFRSLLGSKKSSETSPAKENKKKSKWAPAGSVGSSVYSKNHVEDPLSSPYVEGLDANKHAIAVATATAAVAEAALAAAQAAAEVVRLTSGGGSGRGRPYFRGDQRPIIAAIKIQSAFRAYLARRALRALKGLVKLQALVRGHIVRKQSSDMLRRMQAMARIQARASAHRTYSSDQSSNADIKFSNSHHVGNKNLGKYEERSNNAKNIGSLLKQNHSRSRTGNNVNKESSPLASRWLNHWMEQYKWNYPSDTSLENGHVDDNKSDKILEIDTWKPHQNTRRNDKTVPSSQYFSAWNNMGQDYPNNGPLSRLSSKLQKPNPSISSEDVLSVRSSKFPPEGDQVAAWTADSIPRMHSASSRPSGNIGGPFTPGRSECSRSLFGDNSSSHSNYMANTESSRAKLRSHSAPKQRMQFEENAKFGHNLWESDTISEKGSTYHLYSGCAKRHLTPTSNASTSLSSVYGRWL